MIEIKVEMDENGRVGVTISEGVPLLMALGIVEVAKDVIMHSQVPPNTEQTVVGAQE